MLSVGKPGFIATSLLIDLEFEIALSDLRGVFLLIYGKIPITAVKMFVHL